MIKKNLTRKDITNRLHSRLGISRNLLGNILDDFFESLVTELITKKKIKISSFGTFEVKNKKERIGRNPKNKIEFKISSRKIVKFKPSDIIKKKLNN
mgnify:CR=1 FL=1|jgi:integration host factor subunit alpha|tara:strand:+ start:222 stop:512 length:291 start_codon:yes stop_codon:yes gene_type:complete